MDKKEKGLLVQKKMLEQSLKQEYERTLEERIRRTLEVKRHLIIPAHHFAQVSTEASILYRDGNFYGCISLIQAVAEALVKFMCQKNNFKPSNKFENNIQKLKKRGFITEDLEKRLLAIWEKRDDYHHLKPGIEREGKKLEELAKRKVELLSKVEGEVFKYSLREEKLILENPKYWNKNEKEQVIAYIRFD